MLTFEMHIDPKLTGTYDLCVIWKKASPLHLIPVEFKHVLCTHRKYAWFICKKKVCEIF